jgi:predicted nucleotidyltransferase
MPDDVERDLARAAEILKRAGATEVYVFGSAATGAPRPHSDIDLATRGLPPERFFRAMTEVGDAVSRPIDLIDLDAPNRFTEYLVRKGKLRRVG